jgi:Polyketide cyclase / dehydrase and lipid transport
MKTWGPLLVILAVPLIVIGGATAAGLSQINEREVFAFAVLVFVVGTTTTTVAARARKPDFSKGIDEQAITVEGVLVGASVAFGLGAVSFALATGWPVVGLAVAAAGAAWFAIWLPPRFRLMTAECSIVINRDAPAVFAFLSDFRTMVKWDPRCEAVEMLTPEPIGPGTRFSERGRLAGGNPVSGVDQIVDFEPNRRFSATTLSGGMKNLDVVTFEAAGEGTRVSRRYVVELQLWMALIGVALFKSSLARETVTNQEVAWARAKQLLESAEPTA